MNWRKQVCRLRQILYSELEEQRFAREAMPDQPTDLRVIGVAAGDGVVKYGGVRGQTADRQGLDILLQCAAGEEIAGDVIEPKTLAKIIQYSCCFHGFVSSRGHECSQGIISQIADMVQLNVGRLTAGENLRVPRVVALPHENGGDAPTPNLVDRVEDAQLIIDHYIPLCRINALHIGKF